MIHVNYPNGARFGNCVLIYLMSQYIAEKYNLISEPFSHQSHDIKDNFIINHFSGTKTYKKTIEVTDDNILDFLKLDNIDANVVLTNSFFQNPEIFKNLDIINKYYSYLSPLKVKETTKDLFVHVRLGDIKHNCLPFEYYEKQIKKINFTDGVISSDSPDDTIVKTLVEKFNLKIFNATPEYTVRYASQCKQLVLSAGSFSFLIGLFAKDSEKYYIDNQTMYEIFNKNSWDGGFFSAFLNKKSWNNYI